MAMKDLSGLMAFKKIGEILSHRLITMEDLIQVRTGLKKDKQFITWNVIFQIMILPTPSQVSNTTTLTETVLGMKVKAKLGYQVGLFI